MSDLGLVLHRGSTLTPPTADPGWGPAGEVTWLEADPAGVSTSGPALILRLDVQILDAADTDVLVVARVHGGHGYLDTGVASWRDPGGKMAVSGSLRMPESGVAEHIELALPYAVFPRDAGGAAVVEVAVHNASATLLAFAQFDIALPEDIDRVPDAMTVTAHTLVALVRAVDGEVSREEVGTIVDLLANDFHLDELGRLALKRVMRTAAETRHTPESLAEWLSFMTDPDLTERFVNLLYACARADGAVQAAEQAFIDDLLSRLAIHDHHRYGSESLRPYWEELEIEPGGTFDDVKKAYKAMIRDYHPDRVTHLPKGFVEYATKRTAAINEAFAQLRNALEPRPEPVPVQVELEEDPTTDQEPPPSPEG